MELGTGAKAEEHARQAIVGGGKPGLQWRHKALREKYGALRTRQEKYRDPSHFGNSEPGIPHRGTMGTVLFHHNLLVLLQIRGPINQTS